jgi:hypothetical protein
MVEHPGRRNRATKTCRAKTKRSARLIMDSSLYLREALRAILEPLPCAKRAGRRLQGGRADSDFASRGASFYDAGVLELEVYAAGVRDLNKILELDIELEAIQGLHYKVDRNHDIVYMELEGPTVTFREIRSIFRKLGLEPKFVGAIPAELRPKTKTQLLGL